LHDRYHASRRNPWNEVECGDHYARSMASYGVFLAACGFEYHGPQAHIGFAPRLSPENFKCAFTSAEGWGSFSQIKSAGKWNAKISVRWGKLRVKSVALEWAEASSIHVRQGQSEVPATFSRTGKRIMISLNQPLELAVGQTLDIFPA